jgi:O-antigen/teichoic acid export membrane protein
MSLRKQAAFLVVMHAADVLQPLVVLPYAGRVLEPIHFGQYAYALSVGQFAATIVEYGFHWTGQRAAALARHQPAALARLFAEVSATKAILCLVVTVVGLIASDRFLAISAPMFLCAMLTSVGGILFPAWLFIALERAWQAAIAVVVARGLALVCFLIFVTSPNQLMLAIAIQAAVPLVSGVVSLPFAAPIGYGGFQSVTLSQIGAQLRSGWRGFLFTLVDRIFVILPVPLVEHFGGYVAAGQYSVAEKFVGATRPFLRVVSDTLLPRVAYYAHHDYTSGLALIRNSLSTLVVSTALSLCLFFIAPYFIIILFGEDFSDAASLVRPMSVIPILMNVNLCTSNLYMFNFGHERAWTSLTVAGLVIFLAVANVLSVRLADGALAVVLAVVARESVVLVVSTGFFAFGFLRPHRLRAADLGGPSTHRVPASSMPATRGRSGPPLLDPLRSER